MAFPGEEPFDRETTTLMTRVLEDAWRDLRVMLIVEPLDAEAMRGTLAGRIAAAARNGERDPSKLKRIALGVD
jgi:hypothetical protein